MIEDDFLPGPRPAWELAGVQFVPDIAPHETMKLRCVNAAQSALAYSGLALGHATVAEAMADPDLAAFCDSLWSAELVPSLGPGLSAQAAAFRDAVRQRLANPHIRPMLQQIAADGSHKLPPRVLAPLALNHAAGRPTQGLTLVLASWIAHVVTALRSPGGLADPRAADLRAALAGAGGPQDQAAAVLALPGLVPGALVADARFRSDLAAILADLAQHGPRHALRGVTARPGP